MTAKTMDTRTLTADPSSPSLRCIHCLAPSPRLYRQLNSSTFKLSDCTSCGEHVDHYCEREVLLVLLDIVLLRQAAYRHVFWNRIRVPVRRIRMAQICLASCVLRAHVSMTIADEFDYENNENLSEYLTSCTKLTIRNILQIAFLVVSTCLLFRKLLSTDQCRSTTGNSRHLLQHTILAWVLPSCFYTLTLFMHIWEETVRHRKVGYLISSLLVVVFQKLSLQALVDGYSWSSTPQVNNISFIKVVLILWAALSFGMMMPINKDSTLSDWSVWRLST